MPRVRLIAATLMCAFALAAWAQVPTPPSQQSRGGTEKATYLLIDISGSMEDKDAEAEVSKILGPLVEANPAAPVSRTYFRAPTEASCQLPVEIAPFGPAVDSVATQHTYSNDFTPSGEALKAAILNAVKRRERAFADYRHHRSFHSGSRHEEVQS